MSHDAILRTAGLRPRNKPYSIRGSAASPLECRRISFLRCKGPGVEVGLQSKRGGKELYTLSGSRIEDMFKEIAQLPHSEQNRLRHLLAQGEDQAKSRDRAVSLVPVPDSTRELQWLVDHARQYAGQWVALEGDRLIAHGPVA